MSRVLAVIALGAVFVGAALLRLVGWELVFVDSQHVVFTMGDAWYHLHRGLHSFQYFPDILWFDSCLNHPDGAVVPWAPLWDWIVAGVARLTGEGVHHYEVVAASLPLVFGAATVIPVFLLGARLRGLAVGVGAAAIYAVLPIASEYARIGNNDYHAAIAFVGAWAILLYALALDPRLGGSQRVSVFAALAFLRFILVFLWFGSPVYLAPGEVALVMTGAVLGRRDLLRLHALSALATAALLFPLVALAPEPTGGPWSATETSWFHVVVFLAAAALSGSVGFWQGRRPAGSAWVACLRLGVVGVALSGAILLLPGFLTGLMRSADFVGQSDAYVSRVLENFPLLHERGGLAIVVGEKRLGGFLYLFPLAPLAFLVGGLMLFVLANMRFKKTLTV
jgi:asparagine N-glycosylation enzyme membrane subunit Stt3